MITMAICTALTACAMWIFISIVYRDYRNDVLKQNLFDLRDRLFDMAADGRIAFDSPAYGMLRRSINGLLYGAERISFLSLIILGGASSTQTRIRAEEQRYRTCWQQALGCLDVPARTEIEALRGDMNLIIADHIVFTSPALQLILLSALWWALTGLFGSVLAKSIRMRFVTKSGLENFDMVGAAMVGQSGGRGILAT